MADIRANIQDRLDFFSVKYLVLILTIAPTRIVLTRHKCNAPV